MHAGFTITLQSQGDTCKGRVYRIDKAYKCYFIGFDMTTQSYIVWAIDLNEERISANVVFDENKRPDKQKRSDSILEIHTERKDESDFVYVIGIVYRDEEDVLL
jgi:hypothetical protein